MKKNSVILIATSVAGAVWITTHELNHPTSSSLNRTVTHKRSNTNHELSLEKPDRTKTSRTITLAAKTSSLDPNDPDAGLPTIEETLRAARSNVFNFKHHLCQCQCDLDESRIMGVLAKLNLKWPRIQDELGSVAMEHNLRIREEEALRLVDKDPAAAVEFMETHIRYETEKYITTTAAAPWRESLNEGSRGDSAIFAHMLEKLPDTHFDGMVNENLSLVAQSKSLQNVTLENSFKRPQNIRLKTLARLADEGLLEGSPYQNKAQAEMITLIGHAPGKNGSWLHEVAERL